MRKLLRIVRVSVLFLFAGLMPATVSANHEPELFSGVMPSEVYTAQYPHITSPFYPWDWVELLLGRNFHGILDADNETATIWVQAGTPHFGGPTYPVTGWSSAWGIWPARGGSLRHLFGDFYFGLKHQTEEGDVVVDWLPVANQPHGWITFHGAHPASGKAEKVLWVTPQILHWTWNEHQKCWVPRVTPGKTVRLIIRTAGHRCTCSSCKCVRCECK